MKKVLKSRLLWLTIGVVIGLFVIPRIPWDVVRSALQIVLRFLWSQKWGVMIGAGVTGLIWAFSRFFGGLSFHIVRGGRGGYNYEDEEDDVV